MLVRAAVAFLVTLTATPVVILGLRRWNVVDVPNERSSHGHPTPRGGGVSIALAIVSTALLAPEIGVRIRTALLVAGCGFGLIGLLEDLVGISPLRRLPLLFVAAGACAPWLLADLGGARWWTVAFTALVLFGIVGYANAFNFMDGINGISGGQVLVAGVAWSVVGQARDLPWLSAVGLIVAAAALGFLPHNLPTARVFLGDVGSYFLGAVLGVTAVAALRSGTPAEAVLAPLAVYGADTAVTLLRRLRRGDRWYEPHREHVYQRVTTSLGQSHTRAAVVVVATMTACSALGLVSLLGSLAARTIADIGLVAVLATYLAAPALLDRRRRPAAAIV